MLHHDITNASINYINKHHIINDCGICRVAQCIDLGDWIIGETVRLLQAKGDITEESVRIFPENTVQNIIGSDIQNNSNDNPRGRETGIRLSHKDSKGTRTIATALAELVTNTIAYVKQTRKPQI